MNAVRADKKMNLPVVMTREEVAAVLSLMDGTAQLVDKLLYGSGLRIIEAVRLTVKNIDYQMKQLTVRAGRGGKDRFTTSSATLTPLLQNRLAGVKTLHQQDRTETWRGIPSVCTGTQTLQSRSGEWGWPYVFPARNLSVDWNTRMLSKPCCRR